MMDHNSYYHPPFNHLPQHPLYSNLPSPVHVLPPPGFPEELAEPADIADNHYAPVSPSDFIYNSASISHHHHHRQPSRSFSNEPVLAYPPSTVSYRSDPSRLMPVEQSFPTTYQFELPKPAPGFGEHRRQRQSTMNSMGPGPSKAVPPALSLGGDQGGNTRNSSESTVVVIKRGEEEEEEEEEGSLSPVPWVSIPLGQRVKRWEARMPQGKQVEGDVVGYVPLGTENGMGSRSGSNIGEERGEGVIERVVMPVVPGIGTEMRMGVGMDEPRIMPKMGLFRPVRWDGPSSCFSRSKAKARRVRAWEVEEEGPGGNDVHVQRTLGTQNENGNSNRNQNEETENEQPAAIQISSSPYYSRSPKRLKTSTSVSRCIFSPGSAETASETVTTVYVKQEPGLSPPPSALLARIPMYNNGTITDTAAGYDSSGQYDDSLSSRSISPLTQVPTPRRMLFPTPNRTSTGSGITSSQPSLRAVGKQLKKRNREMEVGREESRERARGEGFWGVPGGGQGQALAQGVGSVAQQEQHQPRGSSEERQKGWTTMISGSSEEGEVSSYYENSYSCGQERHENNTHQSSPVLSPTDQEWCHPFLCSSSSSSSSSAPVPETSARYAYVSAPSLSASQYWQQAIQMVQDTCLEASKRYLRAHCVNRGARGGGSPDTSVPLSHRSEPGTVRSSKARRKRKLKSRQASFFSGSSSSSSSSSPSPAPPRRRRRKRQNRTKKRTTTTPPSSPTSPQPVEIHVSDSLLPNMSQICTLLWSRSQSLRLHDTDSIELHAARNMYWLLSWAETVEFAVLPTASSSSSMGSSLFADFGGVGGSPCSFRHRDRDREWEEDCGEGLSEEEEEGYIWRSGRKSEGSGGFDMFESRKDGRAVWEQQGIDDELMKRVFDEGGMLCEFLGYGEGVERLGRVREFYGLW